MFSVTTKPTPLFNTQEIRAIFTLPFKLDNRFLLNELETILFPCVTVEVFGEGEVVEVRCKDYPSKIPLFTHRDFLDSSGKFHEKIRKRPSIDAMVEKLKNLPKLPYIWGGTFPEGVSELFELFKPEKELNGWEWQLFHLRGIDCSGLLYNVTHGTVPRNTGPLFEICTPIDAPSRPLDLIFSPGHVLIYLGDNEVIESVKTHGLRRMDLDNRLETLTREEDWVKFGRFL